MVLRDLPSKISGDTFKNLISPRGYLDRKTKDTLRKLGKTSLLSRNKTQGISKREAIETLEKLKEEGIKLGGSRYTKATSLFKEGAKQELAEQQRVEAIKDARKQAILDAKREKHIKGRIRMDIDDELYQEEHGLLADQYDARGVIGKSMRDQIEENISDREKKIREQTEKRDEFYNPGKKVENTPKLSNTPDLPDMDIG